MHESKESYQPSGSCRSLAHPTRKVRKTAEFKSQASGRQEAPPQGTEWSPARCTLHMIWTCAGSCRVPLGSMLQVWCKPHAGEKAMGKASSIRDRVDFGFPPSSPLPFDDAKHRKGCLSRTRNRRCRSS